MAMSSSLASRGGGLQAAGQQAREVLGGEQRRERDFVAAATCVGGGVRPASVTRTISSIGRMPVMASLAKGNARATAPASLPSI